MTIQANGRPPFRADHIGSLLRPHALRQAFRAHAAKTMTDADFRAAQDAAIRDVIKLQVNGVAKREGSVEGSDLCCNGVVSITIPEGLDCQPEEPKVTVLKTCDPAVVVDGAIDELRVFKSALTPLEVRHLQAETQPKPSKPATKEDVVELLTANDTRVLDAAARLSVAREAQNPPGHRSTGC